MQFEMNYKIGERKFNVIFKADIVTLRLINIEKLKETFQRLGGVMLDDYSFDFPLYINSEIIKEVIRNTCFVCGGLIEDAIETKASYENANGFYLDQKVRKCTSCGHSYT